MGNNMQVTAGFGEIVATKQVGGAHNQRVFAQVDRLVKKPNIVATALTYASGRIIGGQLALPDVVRIIGATSRVVSVGVRGPSGAAWPLRVAFYQDTLATPPADGAALVMTDAEFRKVCGWVDITAPDYKPVFGFSAAVVVPPRPIVLVPPTSDVTLRMFVQTMGSVTLVANTDLTVHIELELD